MAKQYFSKTYGEVTVYWRITNYGDAFEVRVFLSGIELCSGLLNRANNQIPFHAQPGYRGPYSLLRGRLKFKTDTDGQPVLSIDIICESYIDQIDYELYPGDSDHQTELSEPCEPCEPINSIEPCEPCKPIEPIEPIDSIEPYNAVEPVTEKVIVESEEHQDLFPFLYMRTWPEISQDALQKRFVNYNSENASSESLYRKLVEIKETSESDVRSEIEKTAIRFIKGEEPFAEQFLASLSELKDPIKYFARLNFWLRNQRHIKLLYLKSEIERVLNLGWSQVKEYIQSSEYQIEKDRVWQNLFAITIIFSYRPHILDEITNILVMCSLIEKIVAEDQEDDYAESESAADDEALDTSSEILEAAKATIILPKDIFPLPPIGGDSQSSSKATEWIEPYAIGDLQIVRQRLLRYELGEVAYIENVLKCERKETTQRKLNRINESITNVSSQLEDNETDIHGTRADLLNETQRTLATITTNFKNFNTSYGPPTTVKFDGSWSVGNEPDKPAQEYIRKFAKDITTRTANRIARYMSQVRSLSTLDETEETVIHAFDNTGGTSNVIGIYRWINKIYAVHVVNYGYRLMVEFMVKNPAKPYIDSAFHLQSISFDEPIAPGELKLKNDSDNKLKLKNDSETDPDKPNFNNDSYKGIWKNYAEMAIRYDVKDIQPPLAEFKIVTTAFKDGEPITIKKIVVPEGYRAKSAWVTCVLSGDNPMELKGFVGKNDFTLTQSQRQQEIEKMSDEDSVIAACVLCSTEQIFLPLPPKESPSQSSKYCVSIQVKCELSDEKFQEWQIKTYNAILDGYRKKRAEYYAKAGVSPTGIGSHNPLENRNIENNELKKCCTRQLLRQHSKLVGDAEKGSDNNEPSEFDVNQLRYIQFFEQAFEWDEMIYQFYPQWEEQNNQARLPLTALNHYSGTDPLFTSFLQAGSARVLVPVRPDHTMLVLYYLSSGTLWAGTNALTPTINDNKYVSLVNELKILSQVEHECKYVSKPWEITIPTSMIVLQDSSQLPQFQPKVCR